MQKHYRTDTNWMQSEYDMNETPDRSFANGSLQHLARISAHIMDVLSY